MIHLYVKLFSLIKLTNTLHMYYTICIYIQYIHIWNKILNWTIYFTLINKQHFIKLYINIFMNNNDFIEPNEKSYLG